MTLSMKDSFLYHCDALSGFYQEMGALAISDSALSGGDRWSRRRRPDARAVQTCFGARIKRSAGMGTHATAEFLAHAPNGAIVFLHLPGVPLTILRPDVISRTDGAPQSGQ